MSELRIAAVRGIHRISLARIISDIASYRIRICTLLQSRTHRMIGSRELTKMIAVHALMTICLPVKPHPSDLRYTEGFSKMTGGMWQFLLI
jgi:DNA replicative helicase MCM subunit Mcm2 (Cdc46/Mcm family)